MAQSTRLTTPQTLQTILAGGRRFSPAGAARLCAAIATALATEHSAGRVQGGLDPAHVLVYPLGTVKLLPWQSEVVGAPTQGSDNAALMALAADLIHDLPVPGEFARYVMGEPVGSAAQAAAAFAGFINSPEERNDRESAAQTGFAPPDSDPESERARQSPQAVRAHRTSQQPVALAPVSESRSRVALSRLSSLKVAFASRPSWCNWRLLAACSVLANW
ncbi:MAG: hypothetical protein WCI74_05830 [Actinomycetes bacterium]